MRLSFFALSIAVLAVFVSVSHAQSPGVQAWQNAPNIAEAPGANNLIPIVNTQFSASEIVGLNGQLLGATAGSGWRFEILVDGLVVADQNLNQANPNQQILFVFNQDGTFDTQIGVVDLLFDGSSVVLDPFGIAQGGNALIMDMSSLGGAVKDVPDQVSSHDVAAVDGVSGIQDVIHGTVQPPSPNRATAASDNDKKEFAELFIHGVLALTSSERLFKLVLEDEAAGRYEALWRANLRAMSEDEERRRRENTTNPDSSPESDQNSEPFLNEGENVLMLLPNLVGSAATSYLDAKASPIPDHVNRFDVFTSGAFSATDYGVSAGTISDGDSYSGTAGFVYHLNTAWCVGLATSYLENDLDTGNGTSSTESDGVIVSPFISRSANGLTDSLIYSAGWMDNEFRRNTGPGLFATAEPETDTHAVSWKRTAQAWVGPFVTGPVGSLSYITGETDGYTETGGGAGNTTVGGREFDSLLSELGWSISMPKELPNGRITPYLSATWERDWINEADPVDVALVTSPFAAAQGNAIQRTGNFAASVAARRPDADYMTLNSGFALDLPDDFSLRFDYSTQLFRDDYDAHFFSIGARKRF